MKIHLFVRIGQRQLREGVNSQAGNAGLYHQWEMRKQLRWTKIQVLMIIQSSAQRASKGFKRVCQWLNSCT